MAKRRSTAPARGAATPPAVPDKPYFKIGEVAALAGVEPYVLRYWESEFSGLRPQKTRTNQRMYRRADVDRVLEIRRLLYDEGYRIDGAKRRLRELDGESVESRSTADARLLGAIAAELDALDQLLVDDDAARQGG